MSDLDLKEVLLSIIEALSLCAISRHCTKDEFDRISSNLGKSRNIVDSIKEGE